ncbi:MAG: DUF3828 domain-containing protein [Candidatus Eremiobacteraeota bacterium]|nr:DUF3828 domain-containing protein [Candidatus Eremiobacteraeota bacterium]
MLKNIFALCLCLILIAGALSAVQAAEKTPEQVVDACYAWYFKNSPVADGKGQDAGKNDFRKTFSQVKELFQPDLYSMLSIVFAKVNAMKSWKDNDMDLIDAQPFNPTQVLLKKYAIGNAEIKGVKATVPVTLTLERGKKVIRIVELTKKDGVWRISDFFWPDQKGSGFSTELKEMLKKKKLI